MTALEEHLRCNQGTGAKQVTAEFIIEHDVGTTARSCDGRVVIRHVTGEPSATIDGEVVAEAYGRWSYWDCGKGLGGSPIAPVPAAEVALLRAMTDAVGRAAEGRARASEEASWERLERREAALDGVERVRGGAWDPLAY